MTVIIIIHCIWFKKFLNVTKLWYCFFMINWLRFMWKIFFWLVLKYSPFNSINSFKTHQSESKLSLLLHFHKKSLMIKNFEIQPLFCYNSNWFYLTNYQKIWTFQCLIYIHYLVGGWQHYYGCQFDQPPLQPMGWIELNETKKKQSNEIIITTTTIPQQKTNYKNLNFELWFKW